MTLRMFIDSQQSASHVSGSRQLTGSQSAQRGFTLVELMLVIVIMSVFAALAVVSIGGVEQRRLMQQREQLINDLKVVRLESSDQARIYALMTTPATATAPASYFFAEYQPQEQEQDKRTAEKKPLWQPVEDFKQRPLEEGASLQIRGMEAAGLTGNRSAGGNTGLLERDASELIWFGNGEVKPARLQLMMNNQPVGNAIYINSLGVVSDSEQGGR